MSLLVAFPALNSDDFAQRLPKLWSALSSESTPSIRYFIEWFVILGLLKHHCDGNMESLLNRLLEFSLPTGTVISLLTINMHVGIKLDGQAKAEFFKMVFHRILPWFLHNNHMVRMFALFVYHRLWSKVISDG